MSTKDTINTWFREHLAGGALARDTAAYNQVLDALPDLIGRLDPPDPQPQPEPEPAPKPDPEPEATKPDPEPAAETPAEEKADA